MGDVGEGDFFSSGPAYGHSVCDRCFDDEDIRAFIGSHAAGMVCDFCGRTGRRHAIAAPLDDVVEFIYSAVSREYEFAIDCLGWDSEEGGYQGSYWDSRDLLTEEVGLGLPNDADNRLLDILAECFGDQEWCERDPYGLRRDLRLIGSWRQFSESVKHRRRYFFLRVDKHPAGLADEYLAPAELLRVIGDAVLENGLIRELAQGSLVYRARQIETRGALDSPYDFGPPPLDRATKSNRMSPAGIVMFYGSDDWRTAVAEIDDEPRKGVAVGTFRTTRLARVLDLTKLPRRLRFFEEQSDSSTVKRYVLEFLHSFVRSVAEKVERGEREHVDYVPTQVVTEWFRTSFNCPAGPIDGILYPSTQRRGGKSLVLFASRFDVVLTSKQVSEVAAAESDADWWISARHAKAWLRLVRRRTVREPKD